MQAIPFTPWPQATLAAPHVGAEYRPDGADMAKFIGASAAVVGVIVVVGIWRAVVLGWWWMLWIILGIVVIAAAWGFLYFRGRRLAVTERGIERRGFGAPKLIVPWDRLGTVVLLASVQAGAEPARSYLYFLDGDGRALAILYSPLWSVGTMQELAQNATMATRWWVGETVQRRALRKVPGMPGLARQL